MKFPHPSKCGITHAMYSKTKIYTPEINMKSKNTHLKRKIIFQTSIFGFHINFPGCSDIVLPTNAIYTYIHIYIYTYIQSMPLTMQTRVCTHKFRKPRCLSVSEAKSSWKHEAPTGIPKHNPRPIIWVGTLLPIGSMGPVYIPT